MITKAQALAARHRQEFLHLTLKNSDGSPLRARVNGQCKTWKTRPEEFRLPMKHGLYTCFDITQRNAHEWTTQVWKDGQLVSGSLLASQVEGYV